MPTPNQIRAVEEGHTLYPKGVKPLNDDPLKKGSNNHKLGFRITVPTWKGKKIFSLTLEERATCPRSCHHWTDCYGNNMPFAHRYESGEDLEKTIELQLKHLLMWNKDGIVVRLHVLGDFYSYGYIAFWNSMLLKYPKLAIFGYTALDEGTQEADYIMRLNELFPARCLLRFSRSKEYNDSPEDTPYAFYAAEEGFKGKSFTCPEQLGVVKSCANCGLCWSITKTVKFLTH